MKIKLPRSCTDLGSLFPSKTMSLTPIYQRSFHMLLDDSINLLDLADDPEHQDLSETFARGSMLSSMLLPEVAANICIETLHLEKDAIFHEIDRISTLGKFEIFVKLSFRNRVINRGISAVEGYQEIKRLRDSFVHPKRLKTNWERTDDGLLENFENLTCVPENTAHLKVQKAPMHWVADDARIVMRGAHKFLKYMFKDVCKFSAKRTTSLLFSEELVPDKSQAIYPVYDREVKELLADWGVDLSYLRLAWTK